MLMFGKQIKSRLDLVKPDILSKSTKNIFSITEIA